MTSLGDTAGGRARRRPACLTCGFRPFFLAAGLWAAVALGLWIAVLAGRIGLASRFDALAWHVHEMLFGFGVAAVGGFLLTAIPNWTRRLPVAGLPLALLVGLWALGRAACLASAALPAAAAIAADLAYPVALAAVVLREILAGRNWRNLPMVVPVVVLGAANLLMHLEASGVVVPAGLGWRLGLAALLILVSVVGGRIIPSFTRNWLAKLGDPRLPAPQDGVDRAALGLLHAGLVGWAAWPEGPVVGALLLAGAAATAWRLQRWQGGATLGEPLLAILHVGYAWLAGGTALLGLALLGWGVPAAAAIHALTAGAVGTMVVAVMTRASRGHSGRPLTADGATVGVYAAIGLAAACRVAAGFDTGWALPLLYASAGLWIAGFALFVAAYGPMLVGRRGAGLQ